ncbi:hypothetical protein B0H16DRAFT_1458527 [Mycena metata]|uniref:F-box domain-containing protein n=1 Tax=Mycena metata TaxID=1033252 RepID=A0AAD7ND98_9AGAR|nr:hypothetical protein B0H16DRAFT_1458527 [Mycena metata]
MRQNTCEHLCSEHCGPAARKLELNPRSPYPELLLSDAIPSDLQAQEIKKTIRGVDEDIAALNAKIKCLQRSMDALIAQRTDLERFAHDHRGVVSVMRSLPRDILVEIFGRCLRNYGPFTQPEASSLKPLLLVSRRWHSTALTSPSLWRYIDGNKPETQGLLKYVSMQLERSADAPLSITFRTSTDGAAQALPLLLDASPRWEEAQLSLTPTDVRHLFASTHAFPALKRLTMTILRDGMTGSHSSESALGPAFESIPALEELSLWTDFGFVSSAQRVDLPRFPWSRLRRCELGRVHIEDLPWILPLLSADTTIYPMDIASRFTFDVKSPIGALEVGRCTPVFVAGLLNSLTMPSLKKLRISATGSFEISYEDLTSIIILFLRRSACALTSLNLDVNIPGRDFDLVSILGLLEVCGLLHLAIGERALSAELVDALTTHGLVPHLQSLDMDPLSCTLTEATVVAMLESRHPVLHTLRIKQGKVDPFLSQATINELRGKGMEVLEYGFS